MNPYQEIIDWLRSPEGSAWSEFRMRAAVQDAIVMFPQDAGGWNLNHRTGDTIVSPLYLAGVLSIKEDNPGDGTAEITFE